MDQNQNENRNELRYALWAENIPGIGSRTLVGLAAGFGPGLFERLYRAGEQEIVDLLAGAGLSPRPFAERIRRAQKNDPEEFLKALETAGLSFVSWESLRYPDRLRVIPDPPFGLFVKGQLPDPDAPSLAVIGSREATPRGRETARRFSLWLSSHGVQIISGMARGIDSVAGTAAVDAGGKSFAVLGSGADVCYPKSSWQLYERLPERGGVLSEYLPGTAPAAALFPRRNRIISGLADALLVVEAARKSGTMITVGAALDQGKDVYAVPGRPEDATSAGCNDLIRQGAGLVNTPEELFEALYGGENPSDAMWCLADMRRERAEIAEQKRRAERTERERAAYVQENLFADAAPAQDGTLWSCVLLALTGEPRTAEELLPGVSERAGRRVSETELRHALSRLCLQGLAAERFGRFSLAAGQEFGKEEDM